MVSTATRSTGTAAGVQFRLAGPDGWVTGLKMNEQAACEQIRLLAYTQWIQEGCPDHRDVEHWLRAEAEVLLHGGANASLRGRSDDRSAGRLSEAAAASPRDFAFSASAPPRRHGPQRAAVRSGLGTLLIEEQELQSIIAHGISWVEFVRAPKIIRVITHHYVQVTAIIALLGARSQLLPRPARFTVLDPPGASRIQMEPLPVSDGILRRMEVLHEDLAQRLASLSARDSNGAVAPLLSRAAHQHEEMARTLHGLASEQLATRALNR